MIISKYNQYSYFIFGFVRPDLYFGQLFPYSCGKVTKLVMKCSGVRDCNIEVF